MGRGKVASATNTGGRGSKAVSRASSHNSSGGKSMGINKSGGKSVSGARRSSLANLASDGLDDSDVVGSGVESGASSPPLKDPSPESAHRYILSLDQDLSRLKSEPLTVKSCLDVLQESLVVAQSTFETRLAQLNKWAEEIADNSAVKQDAEDKDHELASDSSSENEKISEIKIESTTSDGAANGIDAATHTDSNASDDAVGDDDAAKDTLIKTEPDNGPAPTKDDSAEDTQMAEAEIEKTSAEGAATAALLSSEPSALDKSLEVSAASREEIVSSASKEDRDSIAALGLFEEHPELTDPEYLKKYYGVASYPERDLTDLLPGPIPDQDYTRAKPPNQVQFSTFSAAIEPYFRPYVEEDISFLKQRAVGMEGMQYMRPYALSPYLIPPLGPYYGDVWTEEDNAQGHKMSYATNPIDRVKLMAALNPRGNEEAISDSILETEKISCGPLASRLLSAIFNEMPSNPEVKSEYPSGDTTPNDDPTRSPAYFENLSQGWKVDSIKADYASLEDRLKREFRYVGILDINLLRKEEKKKKALVEAIGPVGGAASIGSGHLNGGPVRPSVITNGTAVDDEDDEDEDDDPDNFNIDWVNGEEEDEICVELRGLQKKLRQVTKINQASKRRLIPLVQEQMAYQEYAQILDDLDKQVDQAYLKRIRNIPKGKKKKAAAAAQAVAAATAAAQAANGVNDNAKQGLLALLDKRQRWIDKIGPVFRPPELMRRMPSTNILDNIEADDDEEDEEEDEEMDGVTV